MNDAGIIDAKRIYASTSGLLQSGEWIPRGVFEVIRYCIEKDIPAVFSRNEPAGSCLDASRKRIGRDGRIGIALRDEMKSLVLTYTDAAKQKRCFAVHCRGDRSVDFHKVKALLPEHGKKAHISLLDELSLSSQYRLCFGIVNPVSLAVRSGGRLLQIFDAGLIEGRLPQTLMTNAGEHTWGMEFDATRLVRAIDGRMIGSICK